MYTYRCPDCGKHHVVAASFDQEYQSPCLRCGSAVRVTAELIHQDQGQLRNIATVPALEHAVTEEPIPKSTKAASQDTPAAAATFSLRDTDQVRNDEPEIRKRRKSPTHGENSESGKSRPNRARRHPAKHSEKSEMDTDQHSDEGEEQSARETNAPTPLSRKPPSVAEPRRPRWKVIAAISAVVLVVGGAGSYLAFGGKKTPKKSPPVAKKSPVNPKTSNPPTTQKKVEEKQPPPAAPKGPPAVDVVLSAPRLSAELKADADEANERYRDKILEVTGRYSKTENKKTEDKKTEDKKTEDKKTGNKKTQNKQAPPSPVRPHAIFLTEDPSISCDLEGRHQMEKMNWNTLTPRQMFTVRGRYVKDGLLKECWLVPVMPTAEHTYKGKTIELVGVVEEAPQISERYPFPSLRFEGLTNSTHPLLCFFPRRDAAEIKKVQPGTQILLKGVCNGWHFEDNQLTCVRIDNCEFIYTSAPPPGIQRLKAGRLLHEYEENLRADYVPPPGSEPRIDKPLPATQIVKEFAAQGATFAEKYRNRVITLTGKLQATARKQTFMLESGNTDQALRIECYFSKSALPVLDKRSQWRVRGLCSGMQNAKSLRMDNCELDEPARKGPTLTADFLPQTPGKALTFDIAVFGANNPKKKGESVQREVHLQGQDGLTETTVTHMGTLMDESLFAEGAQEKWITQNKVKKVRGALSGLVPVYYRRLSAAYVEVGLPALGEDRKLKITWAPALKIGAREGDTWTWSPPSGTHEFTLLKFEEYDGRPCALIQEKITLAADFRHPVEILHTYVKGKGKMEERQWLWRNSQGSDKVLLMEKKAVSLPRARRDNSDRPDGVGRRQPVGNSGSKTNPSSNK